MVIYPEGLDNLGKIKEGKSPEQEIWIDVGAGDKPVGWVPELLLRLKDKKIIYIAIDIQKEALLRNKEWLEGHKSENIYYALINAEAIPVEDDFCDQVFLANFLGDPKISPGTKSQVLKECYRILKPGGYLNIIERYTPPSKEKTKKDIEEMGFQFLKDATNEVGKVRFIDAPEKEPEEKEEGSKAFWNPENDFYLIFQKPEN